MADLKVIETQYKQLSSEELIKISKTPEDLKIDVIPVLQRELLSRGMNEEALELSHYLVSGPSKSKNLSTREIRMLISERLQSGESIESIKANFDDLRVNINDYLEEDIKLENKMFDYMASLQSQGLSDEEINSKLKTNFSLEEQDSEILKARLKRKATYNLIIGYTLVIVVGLLSLFILANGGRIGIGAIIILGIGVWRIYEGHTYSGRSKQPPVQ